jgi:outer membrane protein OmpA-like peptidoglycan-associated protein
MSAALVFTLGGERFLLADAFEQHLLGPEWKRVEVERALEVFDALLRNRSDVGPALGRVLTDAEDRVVGSSPADGDPRALRARLERELGHALGRIVLLERDPPALTGPAPRDLDPVVLVEPQQQEELTAITFDLFDQTGARLAGMPFELEVDGELVDRGTVALGHVHREDIDPGAQGTLRLPEVELVAEQTLVITLTDASGKALGGKTFELVLADGATKSGTLDDGGKTELSDLAAGKALLTFSKELPGMLNLGSVRGNRRRIEVDVGGRADLVLAPSELPVLEFGDINFRLGHAVLLPALSEQELARTSGKSPGAEPVGPPEPEFRALMAEAVLARVFEFLKQNPHKLVCVAGHTDASGSSSHDDKLSEDRALSVALYLEAGGREAWAKHAFANAKADDYQQVLTFAHLVRGYYCNPRGIDGDFGDKSKRALKNFKLAYNADFGGKLKLDDTRREEDWLAFYDVYDGVLAATLGIDREALAEQRELVVFTDPGVLGCGKHFPLGDADAPDAEPAQYAPRDRRVDILFLDADDRVDLRAQPPGNGVYGQGAFVLQGVPVTQFAERPTRPVIEVLEVSDGNFHTGRCVLLPTTVPGIDAPGISATHTFKRLFETLEASNFGKLLCVAGHTDTQGSESDNDVLSADRAENVLRYLIGNLDGWAEHSFAHHKDDDYQRILQWISMQQNLPDVDPGEIDGKFGKKSKAALEAFRKHWNEKFSHDAGFELEVTEERFEGDFHAFFFLYDQALQQELDTDEAGLADKRGSLVFAPIGAMGCGERWTIEAIGEDDHPSGRNRRVDILLLDPEALPELHVVPVGLTVYGMGRFELREPRLIPNASDTLHVMTDVAQSELEADPELDAIFELRASSGGTLTQALRDDHVAVDGYADLAFNQLDTQATYTLTVARPNEEPVTVFADVPFAQLRAQSDNMEGILLAATDQAAAGTSPILVATRPTSDDTTTVA